MEREISLLRLDLAKSQRLNNVYKIDIEKLYAERRKILWKNFDLKLENDILNHIVDMYRVSYIAFHS